MKHVLGHIDALMQRNEPFVLATVLEKHGSAPRGAGACMLVTGDAVFGTIGGGTVEHAAIERARRALTAGKACTETYNMLPNEAADLGMICGGTAKVLFHPILPSAERTAVFQMLRAAVESGSDAWLLRRFCGDACIEMRVLTERDGVWTRAKPVLAEMENGLTFAEPVTSQARVLIFGGGHVSQRVAPLCRFLGMRFVVVEDRTEFADPTLFPGADEVVLTDYAAAGARLTIRASDAVVIMTRGHQADYTILAQALKTRAGYIGCIGSRKKIAITRERLTADGFSEADIARIHTPIGLPIGAETPEEIAVSIVAELIRHRFEEREQGREDGEKVEWIALRERADLLEDAVGWFSSKWRVPAEAYRESIQDCICRQTGVPQWYILRNERQEIIAGAGVIENDFHDRKDLRPNVCALYVEKEYRGRGLARALLNFARADMGGMGEDMLYLITDHIGFYEKCGWTFDTMVQEDDGGHARMYAAPTVKKSEPSDCFIDSSQFGKM